MPDTTLPDRRLLLPEQRGFRLACASFTQL